MWTVDRKMEGSGEAVVEAGDEGSSFVEGGTRELDRHSLASQRH